MPSERLAEAKARIIAEPESIAQTLSELATVPPEPRLARNVELIDRLFASDRLEEILAALEADPTDWAAKELKTLRAKSPLTCKVALRQIAQAKQLSDFAEEMAIEYRLACRMIMEPDFAEGVRAVLIDKDNAAALEPG